MPIYDDTMGALDTGTPGVSAASAPGAGAATDPIEFDSFLPELDKTEFDSIFSKTMGKTTGQVFAPPAGGSRESRGDPGASSGLGGKIAKLGASFQGTPYVWGGTSPSGFDCSGFIQYVYGKMGIKLPRISNQQATAGARVGLGSLRAGDLVAWDNSSRNNGADHIAIYLGNGLIAESPRPGVPNRVRKLDPKGYDSRAWGVRVF